MPCSDSRAWDDMLREERDRKSAAKINLLTRLLCDLCRRFENDGLELPDEVAAWWVEHQNDPGHQK